MKKLILTSMIALLLAGSGVLMAQTTEREYLGLPGDNLNLYAVMNLFQESETLEIFEKGLNDPEQMINNLDLNGDGYVDYIMVLDFAEENIHNIVLRVALNEKEYQDVAVFVVEKLRDGAVLVQLIGDEALYGENYIIEPIYAERPNPGYTGNTGTHARAGVVSTTYYEVAVWPVVRYIYSPTYVVWRPSWRYGYYPVYWQPWRAHYWHYYHGFHHPMHAHYVTYYRPWRRPRTVIYHNTYYTNIRRHSPVVVVNINKGKYKSTYSKPEQRREGEAHFASVYAHRKSGSSTVGRSESRNGNSSSGIERQGAVRQPANGNESITRTGSESRVNNRETSRPAAVQNKRAESQAGNRQSTEVQNRRSDTQSNPAVSPTIQRSQSDTKRNEQPAAVERSRTQTKRDNQPAAIQRSSSNKRETNQAVQPSRTEKKSNNRSTSVQQSRPEKKSSSRPTSVQRSRPEKKSSSPPASVKRSRTESKSSSRPAAVKPSRSKERNNKATSAQPSRTEKKSSSRPARKGIR